MKRYPILYSPFETAFNTNGVGVLNDARSCTVTQEVNGVYELMMAYPITGKYVKNIVKRCIILAEASPEIGMQPFRIDRISKAINGYFTIFAKHLSYDLNGIPVSIFTATSPADAFSQVKKNSLTENPFRFESTVTNDAEMLLDMPKSARAAIMGNKNSILATYGGELRFDKYMVYHVEKLGQDRGFSVKYGFNMTDLYQEESVESFFTGIYPFYKDDDTFMDLSDNPAEKIIHADGHFDYEHILPVNLMTEFEEPPVNVDALREMAMLYMKEKAIGVPRVSIDFRFETLRNSAEYADVAMMEDVELGDIVTVYFEQIGVRTQARVIATIYDAMKHKYERVKVDNAKKTIADTIYWLQENANRSNQQIGAQKKSISKQKSQINAQWNAIVDLNDDIENQQEQINGIDQTVTDQQKEIDDLSEKIGNTDPGLSDKVDSLQKETDNLKNQVAGQQETIENIQEQVDSQGQDISKNKTDIENLQNSFSGLNNNVSEQAGKIEQIENDLGNKASQGSVNTLQEQVNSQGQTINQQGTAIDQLQTDLGGKAPQSTVDNLQKEVGSQGNTIKNLQNKTDNQSTDIENLQNTVTEQENKITQNGTDIGNLKEDVKGQGDTIGQQGETISQQGQIINEQASDIDWLNYLIEETQTELQKLKDIVESGGDTPSGDTQDDSTSTTTGDVGEDQRTTTRIDMAYLASNGSAGTGDIAVSSGEDSSFNNGAQFPITVSSLNEHIIKITIGTTFGAELSANVGRIDKDGFNRWIWSADMYGYHDVIITSETAGAAATGIEVLTKPEGQ